MSTPSASKVESASFRERQTPTPDCTGQQQKKSVSFRSPPQSTPQSQNQHQLALGSGNKATDIKQSPEMKVRQIPVLDLSASHSNPANSASSGHSTDAITIHTPPVISSRAARSKVPSDSSGGANKTGGLSSPRNSKLAKDSPRLKKLRRGDRISRNQVILLKPHPVALIVVRNLNLLCLLHLPHLPHPRPGK